MKTRELKRKEAITRIQDHIEILTQVNDRHSLDKVIAANRAIVRNTQANLAIAPNKSRRWIRRNHGTRNHSKI